MEVQQQQQQPVQTIEEEAATQQAAAATVKPPMFSEGSPGGSTFSSLESLADMTLCPVHCGRLSRPKLLPCGHVFCQSCLDKWSEKQSAGQVIECPMCRRTVTRPQEGAAGLPTSRAHQAILDYLVSHTARQQQKRQESQSEQSRYRRKRSLEMRQDLLTQLSEDLLCRAETESSAASALDLAELAGVRDNLSSVLQRLEVSAATENVVAEEGDSDDDSESDEDNEFEEDEEVQAGRGPAVAASQTATVSRMATTGRTAAESVAAAAADTFTATQREMHRLSRYRVHELFLTASADLLAEGIAGAGRIRLDPDGRGRRGAPVVIVLTENSRQLLLVTQQSGDRGRSRPTPLNIDWQSGDPASQLHSIRVVSMQASRGAVYLTGWRGCTSLLAIVSIEDGLVLRCHTRVEPTESLAAEGFGGFHVESPEGGGGVVAAQPGKRRVEFFGDDLHPTGHWLVFDRLKPRFVAWARQAGTLWVSCPDERLVLAVNDRTGVFRKLSTGDIFQSPPRHIVASVADDGECRVLLADSQQGRLFWIRKRRKYIFLQRLQLPRELPPVTGLSSTDNGRLLVTSRDRIFCMKPARGASASRRRLRCEIL